MTAAEPKYDTQLANDRLMELGSRIVADPKYQSDWKSLALVIDLDGKSSAYGYVYSEHDWEARAPKSFEVLDAAKSLRQAMMVDGESWKACLVQIVRPEMRIHVDFEYVRPERWRINPDNLEAKVEELRPR